MSEIIIIITSPQIKMYNAFTASRQSLELEQIKKRTQADRKYVRRYYNVTRPSLIDSHNKRINSFIRRMEQQPIQIHLDPYLKHENSLLNDSIARSNKRSNSHNTGRKQVSSNIDPYQYAHHQTFKFKDIQDWKSLYTPLQRIERQRNYEMFREKYGDPTIAYRSIGSQSQYKPGHQFREREKNLQINPPMRYTNKPTKQVLAKLKSKYNKNRNLIQNHNHQSKTNLGGQSKQDDPFVRRNTGSSLSGINEDNILGENITQRASKEDQETNNNKQLDYDEEGKNNSKKTKMHFKEIMDLEQNISDVKTRKALREILYKCGIYRKKIRRVITDSEVDQLSEFTEGRDH